MEHFKVELLSVIGPGKSRFKYVLDVINNTNSGYLQWYLRFLDSHFQQLSSEEREMLRNLDDTDDGQDCFYRALLAIATQLTHTKPSIRTLASAISASNVIQTSIQTNTADRTSMAATNTVLHTFVFRSIGMLTMFLDLEPFHSQTDRFSLLEPSDRSGDPIQSEVFSSYQQPLDPLISIPIHQLFKHFSSNIIPASWLFVDPTPAGRLGDLFSEQLVVSCLNFRTLKKVAGIELEFVPYLGMHLEFHEESRRLKLFKYPSWCMVVATSPAPKSKHPYVLDDHPTPYLASLLKDYFGSYRNDEDSARHDGERFGMVDLCNEILLSFRVIFGQDLRSSQIFKEYYKSQRLYAEEEVADPLLSDLCGKHWSKLPAYQDIKLPREKTQYSASKDFPFLRERFVQLQRFVVDQDPSDLSALLHDRRDVLRYWTFWGVIYVGGISILLSIGQLIIGVLQIVHS